MLYSIFHNTGWADRSISLVDFSLTLGAKQYSGYEIAEGSVMKWTVSSKTFHHVTDLLDMESHWFQIPWQGVWSVQNGLQHSQSWLRGGYGKEWPRLGRGYWLVISHTATWRDQAGCHGRFHKSGLYSTLSFVLVPLKILSDYWLVVHSKSSSILSVSHFLNFFGSFVFLLLSGSLYGLSHVICTCILDNGVNMLTALVCCYLYWVGASFFSSDFP
jgi:hypothetical protein